MNTKFAIAVAAMVAAMGVATAQTAAPATAAVAPAALTSGEIRKVDASQGKVTIKHEAIANLDMPAMTMVFHAAKPELLAGLKAGDRIRFRAENSSAGFTVTEIQR